MKNPRKVALVILSQITAVILWYLILYLFFIQLNLPDWLTSIIILASLVLVISIMRSKELYEAFLE